MASGLGGFTLSPPTFADSNHLVLALVVRPSRVSYKVVTSTRSILEVRKTGRGRRGTYKKRKENFVLDVYVLKLHVWGWRDGY